MRMISRLIVATCGLAASAMLTAAVAGPAALSKHSVAGEATSLVEQVHGCHQSVVRGRAGWHYHTRRSCRRVSTSPRRGFYRAPLRRGPVCSTSCRYIGPIKTCRRVCR